MLWLCGDGELPLLSSSDTPRLGSRVPSIKGQNICSRGVGNDAADYVISWSSSLTRSVFF